MYKMFCYSIKLAKEDLIKGSTLREAMKYQRVVDQLNIIVNLLDQAGGISHNIQCDFDHQDVCRPNMQLQRSF